MAYERSLVLLLGAGKAGLTDLRAQLVDTAGTPIGSAIATGFTDLGTGTYLWNYAAYPDGQRGAVYFYSNTDPGTILTGIEINPEEGVSISAQDVWSYDERTLTQSGAQVAAAVAGTTITLLRGDELILPLTGLGNMASRTKLWFTLKSDLNHADDQAILQVEETAGLLYLNAQPGIANLASLTVDDEVEGDITIRIDPAASAQLKVASGLYYDVQKRNAPGEIATMTQAAAAVTGDVTRRTA